MLGRHAKAGGQRAVTGPGVIPTGFTDAETLTGLTHPTVVQFAPDGRVFVAEKRGTDQGLRQPVRHDARRSSPTCGRQVDDYWDRGLLGMALPPNFPTNPYVYVLYTYDAPIGGTAPSLERRLPDAARTDHRRLRRRAAGCRGSRRAATSAPGPSRCSSTTGASSIPSHSIGTVAFGPDGALYVSGGDGASFDVADYGQTGGSLPAPRRP